MTNAMASLTLWDGLCQEEEMTSYALSFSSGPAQGAKIHGIKTAYVLAPPGRRYRPLVLVGLACT